MKQFLSIIVILLTLLLPTVSWGSVQNKGLICFVDDEMVGYWFISNKTFEKSIIIRISDNFVIKTEEKKIYVIDENQILLEGFVSEMLFTVNRKTLKVSDWRDDIVGFCDVYSDKEKHFDKMVDIKRQKQRSYNNLSKDNKI